MKTFIICDGASSGNGRSAGIGVVFKNEKGEVQHTISQHIGKKTNNEAEYMAIIAGLEYAKGHGMKEITVLSDSNLVINQITGEYRAKEQSLAALLSIVEGLEKKIGTIFFDQVPREYTHEADVLAEAAAQQGVRTEVEKKYPFLTYKK